MLSTSGGHAICLIVSTRSDCLALKQLEDQRRRSVVKQYRFTPCCNVLAMPMSQICSVDTHSAGDCLQSQVSADWCGEYDTTSVDERKKTFIVRAVIVVISW